MLPPHLATSSATQLTPEVDDTKLNLRMLFKAMIDNKASDLHITAGAPPQIRVDGSLVAIKLPALNPADTRQLCYSILTDAQRQNFEENDELDLSFGVKGLARFRANIFMQRGTVAGAFRRIPYEISTLDKLGLPQILYDIVRKPRGLVLITGPTGSGKSTTLAAMVDHLNTEKHGHIVTIEDPIEFLHPHKGCLVNQREIGSDTSSFKKALKYVLRQDPDIVLIGEMRDLETIEAALSISETGHLTLATLHTNSAVQTINRIIDVFPPYQQSQIRAQLSFVLEAVLCQQLVPKIGGGLALAAELMIPNTAIRSMIRDDKIHQIYSQLQVGQNKYNMQTMNQSLSHLVQKRQISAEEAFNRSLDLDELRGLLNLVK